MKAKWRLKVLCSGLDNELIVPAKARNSVGKVGRRERLGGLLSFYSAAAERAFLGAAHPALDGFETGFCYLKSEGWLPVFRFHQNDDGWFHPTRANQLSALRFLIAETGN